MEEIGTRVVNDRTEIFLGGEEVLFTLLHPIEAEGGGMIFQPMQALHPSRLVRQRDFPEAHQYNLCALRNQAGNQLTSVGPDAAKGVGRDQNAHRTPGEMRSGSVPRPYVP